MLTLAQAMWACLHQGGMEAYRMEAILEGYSDSPNIGSTGRKKRLMREMRSNLRACEGLSVLLCVIGEFYHRRNS
jgi:hypothetical protein